MEVKAHAKINVTLDIVRRRQDGYHDIETIMHTIGLHDRINIEPSSTIQVDTDSCLAPGGPDNLVYRAAEVFFRSTGIRGGASITVSKSIPVFAGLGGGSADAAATLLALNSIFEAGLDTCGLAVMGSALGADIPFCIQCGGAALATGIGDVLSPLPPLEHMPVVLAKPIISIPTRDIYLMWDLFAQATVASAPGPYGLLGPNRGVNAQVATAMVQGLSREALSCSFNAFEPIVQAIWPGLALLMEEMRATGPITTRMTGSGTTVYGVFDSVERAENARLHMQSAFPEATVLSTWLGKGEEE